MDKRAYLFFSTIVYLFISSCSPTVFPIGKFQSSPIEADGNASDWGLPLRFGNETGTLQYAITNDKENIYISVASNDRNTQMKMLRAGINVYIDANGKKSTEMGLIYPFKGKEEMTFKQIENKNTDPNALKQKMILDADLFNTTGFMNMENRTYDLKETSPIKIAMNFDNYNNLVFEAIIPLKNIFKNQLSENKAPNISVGIIINNFKGMSGQRNDYSSSGNGLEGGGMRGGGGMGGGGMRGGGMGGGGMRGGGMRGGNVNNDPISNWYQFQLAFKPD